MIGCFEVGGSTPSSVSTAKSSILFVWLEGLVPSQTVGGNSTHLKAPINNR